MKHPFVFSLVPFFVLFVSSVAQSYFPWVAKYHSTNFGMPSLIFVVGR